MKYTFFKRQNKTELTKKKYFCQKQIKTKNISVKKTKTKKKRFQHLRISKTIFQ